MKNRLSERLATNGLLTIISLTIVFHFLLLLNIIPYDIVWGGRITTRSQLLVFEGISIVVNMVMLAIVAAKAKLIRLAINPKVIKAALWVMFALFLLNTLGNVLSLNSFERIVFTPVTLLLSLFCFRLA